MALVLDATPKGITANSYATLAQANAYHDGRLFSSVWTSASDANKEIALVQATRLLDQSFEWQGGQTTIEQALRWPRYNTWSRDGINYSIDLIPDPIVEATAELARLLLAVDREAEPGTLGLRSLRVGSIALEFDKMDRPVTIPDQVYRIVAHLGRLLAVSSNPGIVAVPLLRT